MGATVTSSRPTSTETAVTPVGPSAPADTTAARLAGGAAPNIPDLERPVLHPDAMAGKVIRPFDGKFDAAAFDALLKGGPTMVLFTEHWCRYSGPVKDMLPGFAKAYAGRLQVVELNPGDAQERADLSQLMRDFSVRGFPTVAFIKDGEELRSLRVQGFRKGETPDKLEKSAGQIALPQSSR